MVRRFPSLPLIVVLASFAVACGGAIPERIGGWRVEVSPPGNEFYRAPVSAAEAAPPLASLLQLVEEVAPDESEVRRWELQDEGRYFIRAEVGSTEYDFVFSSDGTLLELEYDDEWANVGEAPGEMIQPGSRRSVSLSEVPERGLQAIKALFPTASPSEAWHAETPAGPRYVVTAAGRAFYVRPDGQVQAAGLIEDGALNEVVPEESAPDTREAPLAEAEELLGRHRDRFDFAAQMRRLGKGPDGPRAAFRFVVVGDSRSNPELWASVVEHIGLLDPQPRFVINTGDIVYRGYVRELAEYFVPPLAKTDLPFFVAIGNHDDGDDAKALEYKYLFGNDSLDYFFDYGGWRFVVVDNVTGQRPPQETLAWLEGVLEEAPEGQRIVVSAHKPIGSVEKWAYHSWDGTSSDRFAELMSSHDVAHVFFGHIHAYSTATFQGVEYTITGGGGAGLHDRFGPQGNVHHYVICDVEPDGSLKQQVVRFYEAE
jgi:3',5'-cyclic AMP phosphodiesterase CpdA